MGHSLTGRSVVPPVESTLGPPSHLGKPCHLLSYSLQDVHLNTVSINVG